MMPARAWRMRLCQRPGYERFRVLRSRPDPSRWASWQTADTNPRIAVKKAALSGTRQRPRWLNFGSVSTEMKGIHRLECAADLVATWREVLRKSTWADDYTILNVTAGDVDSRNQVISRRQRGSG